MSDTVFETVNGKMARGQKKYHTDRDCPNIGTTVAEVTRDQAERSGMTVCRACDKSRESNGGGSRDVLEAIQQHVHEETGEDPLAELQSMKGVNDE